MSSKRADPAQIDALVCQMVRSAKAIVGDREVRHRDQHAKHHGCVLATFDVVHPVRELGGLFAQRGSYPAILRPSNSESRGRVPDTRIDGRGLAIKVLLSESKLRPVSAGFSEVPAQDFLLISSPTFFARDLWQLAEIFDWLAHKKALPAFFVRQLDLRGLWLLLRTTNTAMNPLEVAYFSQVPFGTPGHYVKYRVDCAESAGLLAPTTAEKLGGCHLRDVLRRQLRQREVHLRFCVQRKAPRDPLDDPRAQWRGPYEHVADIRLHVQDPGTPERMAAAEALAFNVWNGLPAHEPAGLLNSARKRVYNELQQHRGASPALPASLAGELKTLADLTAEARSSLWARRSVM
jgi:hypothetical protein